MKGWLTENLTLKLIALLLATVLHLFVRGDREVMRSVSVPVMSNLPANQVLLSDPVQSLTVTIRGKQSAVRRVENAQLEPLVVELEEVRNGLLEFTPELLALPPDVTVTAIQPPAYRVDLDRIERRPITVFPRLVGEPAPGFFVQNKAMEINPARVEATGPQSSLRSLSAILTERVDLSGRQSSFETSVKLETSLPHVVLEPDHVMLKVRLEAEIAERVFETVRVKVPDTGLITKINTNIVSVTVRGPRIAVEALSADQLTASVKAPADDVELPSKSLEPVTVEGVPDGLNVVRVDPPSIALIAIAREPVPNPEPDPDAITPTPEPKAPEPDP